MVVWRRKLDNDWLYRAELVVERVRDRAEETDEPTCGPGPFSMADADTTSDILLNAGFDGSRCAAATSRSGSATTSTRRSSS